MVYENAGMQFEERSELTLVLRVIRNGVEESITTLTRAEKEELQKIVDKLDAMELSW